MGVLLTVDKTKKKLETAESLNSLTKNQSIILKTIRRWDKKKEEMQKQAELLLNFFNKDNFPPTGGAPVVFS